VVQCCVYDKLFFVNSFIVTADDILRAQGIEDISTRAKKTQLSFEEQQKRASAINDIESGDFIQETFKSSRSEVLKFDCR